MLLAAHYAVPFAGAVLVALNTRITPADIAFILEHAGASVLIFDDAFAARPAGRPRAGGAALRLVRAGGADDELEAADRRRRRRSCMPVADERALLAINYTSGTTGAARRA